MWTCPKCARTFKRTNQSHYCGKAPETVGEYIDSQPAETHAHLTAMRTILLSSVPEAHEHILWSMPYYEKEGKSLSFSACKTHISLYAGAEAIERFAPDLNGWVVRKNAVYLPYDAPLPAQLIARMAKWCLG